MVCQAARQLRVADITGKFSIEVKDLHNHEKKMEAALILEFFNYYNQTLNNLDTISLSSESENTMMYKNTRKRPLPTYCQFLIFVTFVERRRITHSPPIHK